MSTERATYVDSSALVKLAVREEETVALRRYLRRHQTLVASTLARTEGARALLPFGPDAVRHGEEVLARLELVRVNDRLLRIAGALLPADLRSLDAIHLATASALGKSLRCIVTYDQRMSDAAHALGFDVRAPA